MPEWLRLKFLVEKVSLFLDVKVYELIIISQYAYLKAMIENVFSSFLSVLPLTIFLLLKRCHNKDEISYTILKQISFDINKLWKNHCLTTVF